MSSEETFATLRRLWLKHYVAMKLLIMDQTEFAKESQSVHIVALFRSSVTWKHSGKMR